MPIDLDVFDSLDMNHDLEVDETDLKMHELSNGESYSLSDLDHDMMMDRFESDLNNDEFIDEFQADLDNNSMIDRFETNVGFTKWNYDINGDNNIDYIDEALAKNLYG